MGIIIALSGVDGSGKTTIAKIIMDYLKKKYKTKKIKIKYIITFDHFLLKYILRFKISKKKRVEFLQCSFHEQRLLNKVLFFLWPYCVFIDTLIFVLYAKYISEDIYIFDRYIHDFFVAFYRKGYVGNLFRILVKFFPKPDIHIYVSCRAETAKKRTENTHNLPITYFRECQNIYNTIVDTSIIKINTEAKIENVKKKIFKILKGVGL